MRRLTVQPVCRALAYVSGGPGTRELIAEVCGGTSGPVWSSLGRAYCIQPYRVPDLIALAEDRRFEVTVLEQYDPLPHSRGVLF